MQCVENFLSWKVRHLDVAENNIVLLLVCHFHPLGAVFRDIEIANVRGVSESGYASSISGVTGCRVRDVRLRNVDVVCRGAGRARSEVAATRAVPDVSGKYPECNMFGGLLPAYGLWVDKVDGLTLENVSFRLREGGEDVRPAVVLTPDVQVLSP